MKTAMQQMIEWLNTIQEDYSEIPIESVLKYANELYKKERDEYIKAIEDAFTAGEECGLTESHNSEWGDIKEVINKSTYIANNFI